MKVISNYKDYYDFVAHRYGGGDPMCRYVRNISSSSSKKIDRGDFPVVVKKSPYYPVEWYDILFFCGDVYICEDGKIVHQLDNSACGNCFTCRIGKPCHSNGVTVNQKCTDVAKKLQMPVCYFTQELVTYHCDNVNLRDLGFDKIVSPEQAYQRIEHYIRNVLTDSPDLMPPTKMSDKEKILSNGFDVVQSFRHRE